MPHTSGFCKVVNQKGRTVTPGPSGCSGLFSLGRCRFLRHLVSASESLNTTFSVNNALLTGKKRVACTADFYLQRLKG
jgi:hypothetical protein